MKGIKYLLLVTVFLLAVAFVLTKVLTFDFDKDEDLNSVTDNNVSSSSGISDNTGSDTSISSETVKEENPDVNIDNEWAMFLVNNNNPLPANYDDVIETTLVFTSYKDYYLDSRVAPYMIKMLEDSKKDGVDLQIVSAYRSCSYQQQNFDNSLNDRIQKGMTYEEAYQETAANVALPGKSEHNAGVAADIMTSSYSNMDDDGFKNTPEYKWLDENAYKYGFILRYPENKTDKTGIIYEPWHYRFVGEYYAKEIKDSGLCLEEYFEQNGWVDAGGKATQCLGPVEAEKTELAEPATTTAPTQDFDDNNITDTQQVSIVV